MKKKKKKPKPKADSKDKRPTDPNQLAKMIVDQTTDDGDAPHREPNTTHDQ